MSLAAKSKEKQTFSQANPPPTIQKFSHAKKCLFKCKYPTKHNRNILSLGKLSYGGLFNSIKLIVHPSMPIFNWLFQRLSNAPKLQWIYEQWPVVHMLNVERISKSFCLGCWPAFWQESQMYDLASLILVKFPSVWHKRQSNNPQDMPGGWAVLELTSTLF